MTGMLVFRILISIKCYTVLAEPESSTQLILKPINGYNLEPLPPTFHLHNYHLLIQLNVIFFDLPRDFRTKILYAFLVSPSYPSAKPILQPLTFDYLI